MSDRGEVRLSRRQAGLALLIAALAALLLALILTVHISFLTPLNPASAPLVQGQPSPTTILATERVTFPSSIRTAQAQDQAAALVPDIYNPPDAEIARRQVRVAGRLLAFLDTIRADPYTTRAEKVQWVSSVPSVTVSSEVVSRTLALEVTPYRQVISETLYVLDQAMREEIRASDLAAAANKLPSRVSLVLSADQADQVTQWVKSFLIPNTTFDAAKTTAARDRARDSVGVVYRTYEKGQALVRAGEVITPETFEALRELGYLQPQSDYLDNIASIIFSIFLIFIGALYVARFAPHLFRQPRVLVLLALLLIGTALGAKILVPGRSIIPYLFPFAAAAMMGAALLNAEIGTGLALLVGLAVGYIARGAIELTMFALVGGMVAVLTLRHRDRLTSFVITGVYVALANAALILVFRLLARDDDPGSWFRLTLAAAASGALAGLIALGSQFVLGKLADLPTALELIELARPTHPLLQKLLREAPGTYHHSLIISNLAEQAAQRIGADALLARVGAYYHDVGKTMNPQLYSENQFEGINLHDTLDPRASAAIIHQHVLDGLTLTKRYGVSNRVRDFIPQHHGTTIASYFYNKALSQSNGAPVGEEGFRYPGPKPQSREAAIMMLADGVEATARAERPTNAEQIRAIIDQIVELRVQEGQLDESDVTLRDLEEIKRAFFEVLQGLYHPRVRYPSTATVRERAALTPVVETVARAEADGN